MAYAIYESEIPVISAVGHEPDVTISDYVADLRAATPSNAAELAVPDQDSLRQLLDSVNASLTSALSRQIKAGDQHLKALSGSPTLRSPLSYLEQRRAELGYLSTRLFSAQRGTIDRNRHLFIGLTSKLEAMSPLKVLTRGYAMVYTGAGEMLKSVEQVSAGDEITLTLKDGRISATVTDGKGKDNG